MLRHDVKFRKTLQGKIKGSKRRDIRRWR